MNYEFYGWFSETGEIFGWEETEQEVRWRLKTYGIRPDGTCIVVPEKLFKKAFLTADKYICQNIRPDPLFLKFLEDELARR
jgi:hypothetical protein